MKLNEAQLAKLLGTYRTDGCQVIIDILESICVDAENEFIGDHPKDKEMILAHHSIMYAQRAMFIEFQRQVEEAAATAMGIPAKKVLTQQERVNKILNMDGGDQSL